MKQIYIEKTNNQSFRSIASPVILEVQTRDENSVINIFLDQNSRKGPPGRSCSPVNCTSISRAILFNASTISSNCQLLNKNNICFTQFLN